MSEICGITKTRTQKGGGSGSGKAAMDKPYRKKNLSKGGTNNVLQGRKNLVK